MLQISSNIESAKQTERAHEMRRVHPTALGFICPIHSPESEKVGINKQLAYTATILPALSSEIIKDIVLNDDDVYKIEETTPKSINEVSDPQVNAEIDEDLPF